MVNFKYNPNELGIKNVWWGKEEKYWIEISNKDKNEEHKKYNMQYINSNYISYHDNSQKKSKEVVITNF